MFLVKLKVGKEKRTYLVDAVSPTDAEVLIAKINEGLSFEITSMNKATYTNIFESEDLYFYSIKLSSQDEVGKEVKETFLVNNDSIEESIKLIKDSLGYGEVTSVTLTDIIEIVRHAS